VPTDAFGIQTAISSAITFLRSIWSPAIPTGRGVLRPATVHQPQLRGHFGLHLSGLLLIPMAGIAAATSNYRYGALITTPLQTAQWCADGALTASTCKSGSAVIPGTHTFIAGEFPVPTLNSQCAVGTALTAAHIYSGVRWCTTMALAHLPAQKNRQFQVCQTSRHRHEHYRDDTGKSSHRAPSPSPRLSQFADHRYHVQRNRRHLRRHHPSHSSNSTLRRRCCRHQQPCLNARYTATAAGQCVTLLPSPQEPVRTALRSRSPHPAPAPTRQSTLTINRFQQQ